MRRLKLLNAHLAEARGASRLKANPEFEAPSCELAWAHRGKPSGAAGVKTVGVWSP